MQTVPRVARRALVLATLASSLAVPAWAQGPAYPNKPIRVIVNSAPGGLTDVVARLLGTKMSTALGQPLVVENRPGGAGLVGAEAVARAEPDGYTVGILASAITVAPTLVPGSTFDARKDLAPVALLTTTPMLLVTNPNSPYKTLAQVVADAKGKPGQIPVASGGNATMTHLVAEQFMVEAGLNLVHVPYKGGGPALNDILANQVPIYFDTMSTSTKLVQEGRLRALAIVAPQRSPALPDVPTIAEAGFPGVQGRAWFALVAPANTPPAVLQRLNDEANKALAAPDVKERLIGLGGTVEGGSPKVLSDLIQQEVPRWTRLVKDRNIRM
ncbi:MAG TPA: tripartite tricarboxylate transporter substrate binding protein [Ramlibacter sp.]|nr:tripartite tricarboxylate transporter substrate binding protein [Ramlibacter sp.]